MNSSPKPMQQESEGSKSGGSNQEASLYNSDSPLSLSQRQFSSMMLSVLDVIKDATNDPEIQANVLSLLFHVAQRSEPAGILELAKLVGVSDAAASRGVAVLGRGLRGKAGAGLVETREDPLNYSKKQVILSAKGKRLLGMIEDKVIGTLQRIK